MDLPRVATLWLFSGYAALAGRTSVNCLRWNRGPAPKVLRRRCIHATRSKVDEALGASPLNDSLESKPVRAKRLRKPWRPSRLWRQRPVGSTDPNWLGLQDFSERSRRYSDTPEVQRANSDSAWSTGRRVYFETRRGTLCTIVCWLRRRVRIPRSASAGKDKAHGRVEPSYEARRSQSHIHVRMVTGLAICVRVNSATRWHNWKAAHSGQNIFCVRQLFVRRRFCQSWSVLFSCFPWKIWRCIQEPRNVDGTTSRGVLRLDAWDFPRQ